MSKTPPKTTLDLRPGDTIHTDDGDHVVVTVPAPTPSGRWRFEAHEVGSAVVVPHEAQPDFQWVVTRPKGDL